MYRAAARHSHSEKGFTLLESIIALAIWSALILAASVLLTYVSRASARALGNQNEFENARAAMDALTVNLQMAERIVLESDGGDTLQKLTLTEEGPEQRLKNYEFYFDSSARPGAAKYHRLEFGLNDEFASNIEEIKIIFTDDGWCRVTVTTDGEAGAKVTLERLLDIRYKNVTVIRC